MGYSNRLNGRVWPYSHAILIILSFVLWCYFFRGFLFRICDFASDAIPYYNHTKFFIDNISRGVYPLWDPFIETGIANEFFLRRIGEFNPFYTIILILTKLGVTYPSAYLTFLVTYYFIGLMGFYLLAKRFTQDDNSAFVAYALLMFSSLGTQLFYNFLILIFVPTVWFFYFLVSFSSYPSKHSLLGMVFSVMIILTTYIPFYFLTIMVAFSLCYLLLYFGDIKMLIERYWRFVAKNRLFVFLCCGALILSALPGMFFYLEGRKSEFVLPVRHIESEQGNVLEVARERLEEPGVITHIKPEWFLSNLNEFELGRFYLPIFVYIIFLLGLLTRMTKGSFLLVLLGFIIFLISSPEAVSLHGFLSERIFFFKFFRNLRFFLELVLSPILILHISCQLKSLLDVQKGGLKGKVGWMLMVIAVHIGFFIFLIYQPGVIISSYVVILLSFTFFVFYGLKGFGSGKTGPMICLLVLIVAQPIEVYKYLNQNSIKFIGEHVYDQPYLDFRYLRAEKNQAMANYDIQFQKPVLYIATKWFNALYQAIAPDILDRYLNYKFIVYDQAEHSTGNPDFKRIEEALAGHKNLAFIEAGGEAGEKEGSVESKDIPGTFMGIEGDTDEFQILDFNVNSIQVKTNFATRKFLVYNDSFYRGWRVFINNKEETLRRTNVAFKGVWVPAGEQVVDFQYAAPLRIVSGFLLLGLFHVVFMAVVVLWRKDVKGEQIALSGGS